jgi:hypothetical protein
MENDNYKLCWKTAVIVDQTIMIYWYIKQNMSLRFEVMRVVRVQVFLKRGPPMCFVRPAYIFLKHTVLTYMMKNSSLISDNRDC